MPKRIANISHSSVWPEINQYQHWQLAVAWCTIIWTIRSHNYNCFLLGNLVIIMAIISSCAFKIIVAFDHNKLWWPPATNSIYVTFQMLWHLTTRNCSLLSGLSTIQYNYQGNEWSICEPYQDGMSPACIHSNNSWWLEVIFFY